ncbi:hypothetical protein [Blastococcus brunescens]|uniref:Agenet domain-containing protein n=1 Tax=Blastococcus brunescens TaxID=1564165 RepID=A0ABZ1AW27_9ACTN|nr:hypothetical protein [Blastococcus sp. BMG 8361]WRL62773.1 hypothetical protein U6N30_23145 [Blastococcus sp. BMG 8361]
MVGDETASMFAGQPQPVEIHHRGIWYSGELIGWRHESNGRVAARVRCRVDGLRHSAWMDLADLRLPDPKRPPHKEPFPAVVHRPVPAGAWDADDATRPNPLLTGLRTRAAKPAHAVQPPAPRTVEPAGRPDHEQAGAVRRNRYLRKHEAYLSVV